ncbi:hypothetical protein [Frankia sp. BMG5.23]|uniref:hypothetical protein n=1 Tax=Frankia sp. BMG5.23 TaxID=683305 RepID=UPI00046190E0|nr:hypothetical protein [Frankia sp. BMG5.23]KDA44515.1 hypothetical protein BMG523Draft_00692 [Frankia sp. BMG5.23]
MDWDSPVVKAIVAFTVICIALRVAYEAIQPLVIPGAIAAAVGAVVWLVLRRR